MPRLGARACGPRIAQDPGRRSRGHPTPQAARFPVRVLPTGAGRTAGAGNKGGYFDTTKIDVVWNKPPARKRDLAVTK